MIPQQQLPVVGVCRNPLLGVEPAQRRVVAAGTTLRDLAPAEYSGLLICRVNGGPGYVLREDWGYPVQCGDVVEFLDMPQGSGTLRSLLQIAITVAAVVVGSWQGALIALVGNALVNALLPPAQITRTDPAAVSPTYSTSLAGNQARPDSPVPKNCGRMRIVPPFAGQPYLEYDSAGDQYYYAVLVVGYGNHTIERAMIDDTSISHFSDILVSNYLPPGAQPAQAKANVVTAPEVSGLEMLTGKFVGGFAASGPTLKAERVGIDMVAPRGLAHQNDDGSMGNLTMSWRVDWREIDDFGAALTTWAVLGSETRTTNQIKVQRWTFTYTLASPKRVEIRVVRTDVKSTSSRDSHDLQWAGLRAYLDDAAPLNAGTAHYEIVMRASEQLSTLSQRSVALIVQAHARAWSPGGSWGAEAYTRNPMWWATELATNEVWGLGLSDARVDLQSFYELSLTCDARQDRFDYSFDSTVDGWEALQMIARAARARVFRRNGVLTIARDGLATLPITAFTPRNTQPDSMELVETLPTREMSDGFIIEYFNNRTWTWLSINCPCPGITTMAKPVRMRLPGITGAKHAEREGRYEAARLLYRRRKVRCVTEMEGMLPAFMSPVRWMPEIYGYGQSGDVVDWNAVTKTMTLSEPLSLTSSNYLTLMRDDGTLTDPVEVSPGSTAYTVVLPEIPDFNLVLDDGGRERPRFMFGNLSTSDDLVRISGIADGGKTDDGAQLYEITGVVDDTRVHAADNALLPTPGEVQDPVDSAADVPGGPGGEDTGGGTEALPQLSHHEFFGGLPPGFPSTAYATFTLSNTGSASFTATADPASGSFANEWLLVNPVELATASRFEVRATLTSSSGTGLEVFTGTTGAWLSLATSRTWNLSGTVNSDLDPEASGTRLLFFEIREASTGIVQASASIYLTVNTSH